MQWPWARRKNIYDPLTPLDRILLSPLRVIVQFIYLALLTIRGAPFKPTKNKPAIRIVCISDTHTRTPNVPVGDLLIHSGDLTNAGTIEEIQAQLDWLEELPHRYKLVIAGNHDSYFDVKSRKDEDKGPGKKLNLHRIHYLQDESIQLRFKGGRTLNIYGAADIPQCGGSDFAFQYRRDLPPWTNRIPISTDVLITHTPPRYHLDLDLGCSSLLEEIWRVKPRLHVFGHVHSGHGRETVFWDPGQAAYERLMSSTKHGVLHDLVPNASWIDALRVIWYGVKGVLWQYLMVGNKGANGGVLVNAALAYQSSNPPRLGNPAEVVVL
ncbi:MAG: hypothetical protein M1818_007959 [Claussenomyces sp. TS43310]|nr:MAG: hypothetical protein M1818_007959 [Claussenomyces sp. TS43310]